MNLHRVSAAFVIMAACALLVLSSPLQQPTPITVNGDDETKSIDCKGDAVSVLGDDNNLTLKGECSRLTVTGDDNEIKADTVTEIAVIGDDNKVAVEIVAKISLTGDDNSVTWKKGLGLNPPQISNTGDDNTTKQDQE